MEGAQEVPAHLDGTVGQVGEVRRREREGICRGEQLGGDPPAGPGGRNDLDDRRPVLEPARPHERCWHVDVCVGGVHRQIRSVHPISVHPIPHPERTVVRLEDPAMRSGVLDRQDPPGTVSRLHVEDVRGEFVQGVSSR